MRYVPIFNARLVSNSSFDKLYRIYAVGDQLYFIRIGGHSATPEPTAHGIGVLGVLIASLMQKRAEKRERALMEAVDQTQPLQLLPRHADNFRLSVAEIRDGSVDPPSFYAVHGPHVGRCALGLKSGERMIFQFETTEDMRIALDVLPELLVSGLRVNVRWNEARKRYEKRENAA